MTKLIALNENVLQTIAGCLEFTCYMTNGKLEDYGFVFDALNHDVKAELIEKLEAKRYFAKSGSGMLVNEGVVTAIEIIKEY